jgi:hypothetical protein
MEKITLSLKIVSKFYGNLPTSRDENSCWEWQGPLWHKLQSSHIYGRILRPRSEAGKTGIGYLAHRVSYYIFNNIDPLESLVLHKCDNTKCVNPKHLFLGTSQNNIDDCVAKNRFRSNSFLTDEKVKQIKILYPSVSKKVLAKQFNASEACIYDIVKGRRWKHVTI